MKRNRKTGMSSRRSVKRRVGRGKNPLDLIPMPERLTITQCGSNDQCDMLQGPCACGAWHNLNDWPEDVRSLAPNPKLTDG